MKNALTRKVLIEKSERLLVKVKKDHFVYQAIVEEVVYSSRISYYVIISLEGELKGIELTDEIKYYHFSSGCLSKDDCKILKRHV